MAIVTNSEWLVHALLCMMGFVQFWPAYHVLVKNLGVGALIYQSDVQDVPSTSDIGVFRWQEQPGAAPWGGGGQGGQKPPKDSKKGKIKNMGYFHASKLSKLAFLSSLTRKYVLWKGFYHDFSTKKASASGGNPHQGVLPPGPLGSLAPPLTIYPGATPGSNQKNRGAFGDRSKIIGSFQFQWKCSKRFMEYKTSRWP